MRPNSKTGWLAVILGQAILVACTTEGATSNNQAEQESGIAIPTTVIERVSLQATTAPITNTTRAPSTTEFRPSGYELAVISRGAEPRHLVGQTSEAESNQRLWYRNAQALTVEIEGTPAEPVVPTEALTSIEATAVSLDDSLTTVRYTLGRTEVSQDVGPRWAREALEQSMAAIEGQWFELLFYPGALERETRVRPGLNDLRSAETLIGFAETMTLVQVPTPDEPLGVGGIWNTITQQETAGLPSIISSRSTITEVAEGAATAEVTIEVLFFPGDVELSSGSATILSGHTHITGTLSWTSDSPIALYEMSASSTISIRVSEPSAEPTTFTQMMQQTYSLQSG